LLLALNKAIAISDDERARLLARLREHAAGLVRAEDVIACAAHPADRLVVQVAADGRKPKPAIRNLPMSPNWASACARSPSAKARRSLRSTRACRRQPERPRRCARGRGAQGARGRVIRNYCWPRASRGAESDPGRGPPRRGIPGVAPGRTI